MTEALCDSTAPDGGQVRVGPSGRIIGVDLTDATLDRAIGHNAAHGGGRKARAASSQG